MLDPEEIQHTTGERLVVQVSQDSTLHLRAELKPFNSTPLALFSFAVWVLLRRHGRAVIYCVQRPQSLLPPFQAQLQPWRSLHPPPS